MMKLSVLLVLTCVIALAWTLPIDDPNDDVELVPSSVVRTSTNNRRPVPAGDVQGGVPVFIIRTSSGNGGPLGSSGFLPFFEAILGGGRDRVDDNEDEVEVIPSFPPIGEIDLNIDEDDLFAPDIFSGGEVISDDDKTNCGLFCMIFRTLGTQLKSIEEQLEERENQVPSSGQGEPEITYEEKVLDDGTVIKIKKTSYSDNSDDGTSYFGYHSTKVVVDDDDEEEKKPEEPATTRDYPDTEDVSEDDLDEEVNDVKPIKLVRQDNLRKRRQANDPFNQQTEDLSYFNQISQSPFNQVPTVQVPTRPVYYSPQPLYPGSLVRAPQPVSIKPITLEGDTRVNDLLLENARRGGLVRIEPDSEFIDEETAALSH